MECAQPPPRQPPVLSEEDYALADIGREVETLVGSLVPFPEAGSFPAELFVPRPAINAASPPFPDPPNHNRSSPNLPAVHAPANAHPTRHTSQFSQQNVDVLMSATLGKIERLSKHHKDPAVRQRLAETVTKVETVLDTYAQEELSGRKKPPLSTRVIRALTRLRKELPALWRILLVVLVAIMAPLVLAGAPALPLLGL